jgi:predicted phosphoribosyltransferase
VQWLDRETAAATRADEAYVRAEVARQVAEAQRRSEAYGTRTSLEAIDGHPAIVIDDGIATGSTALVALRSVRGLGASEVVLATPVASPTAARLLSTGADRVVTLETPAQFAAVGLYYDNFAQVSDEEVLRYVEMSAQS